MERNVQRIDGQRVHLHLLSTQELETQREYALDRMQRAHADVELLDAAIEARRSPAEMVLAQSEVVIERTPLAQTEFAMRRVDL